MSTTDTIRAAFEAWVQKECDFCLDWTGNDPFDHNHTMDAWVSWQAATEAAKATGTAGELPPMPDPHPITEWDSKGRAYDFDQMREYGQQCAEAARHDKDGNHADDLRAWLDEARDEIEIQGVAFHATSLKLKAAEAELAARHPAPVEAVIRQAILDYYDDLTARKHGGVAMDKAFNKIQDALGMCWQDEALIKRSIANRSQP